MNWYVLKKWKHTKPSHDSLRIKNELTRTVLFAFSQVKQIDVSLDYSLVRILLATSPILIWFDCDIAPLPLWLAAGPSGFTRFKRRARWRPVRQSG